MGDVHLCVGLAVDLHALHVAVLVTHTRSLYDDMVAVFKTHVEVRHIGSTDYILVCARAYRVETE